MPSVGMRRTTRVFGVVKASDGARVLRSGRRIWPNVGEPKVKRAHDVVDRDWNTLLNTTKTNKISGPGSKPCSPRQVSSEKEDDFQVPKRRKVRNEEALGLGDDKESVDKLFGIVYSRKRKRLYESSSSSSSPPSNGSSRSEEPIRSLKFYRRRKRLSSGRQIYRPLIALTVDWLSSGDCWLSSVFGLVMRYIRRKELRLSSLANFFLSQPVKEVFADHGVRFLTERPISSRGVWKFFEASSCLPVFSAEFSAIPRCFMDVYFTLFLRGASRSFVFVKKSLHLLNNPVEEESDQESELALTELCNPRNGGVVGLHPSSRAGNAQYRGNLGSNSFKKRRSSLRRKRARNLSHNVHKLYNGTSVSDLSGSRKNRSAAVSSRVLRSSVVVNNSIPVSNGISSVSPKPKTKEELDSLCCSVNILTIESDRCTREEGFSVMLEFISSSKEWFLVVKKDGVIKYSHTARRTMRPCSSNRFTHSVVWMEDDNNWKLEFCDRQDWIGFKDIYKECYERNVLEQSAKVIPIPGVREVYGYAEDTDDFHSFSRPVSYISLKEDEVSRVMARSIALYDMDSEDEEWLERQNQETLGEELERDDFESMIDGFEKRFFHSHADDLMDDKTATIASLSHLGRQEVVEAVHEYWVRKRKQRKAPLLRVLQGQQAKKTSLLSKTVFRKRRSFKRQGRQLYGKGKQLGPLLVSAKTAEQEASEEQDVILRAENAKAVAKTATEIAIAKRARAQLLAEKADLAVYKAMMALKIAEAMKVAASSEDATSLILD